MKLYYIVFDEPFTASSAAPDYPASNLQRPEIPRFWTVNFPGAAWFQYQRLGTSNGEYIALQDVSPGTTVSSIDTDTTNPPLNTVPGLTIALDADDAGRRKGISNAKTTGSFSTSYVRVNLSGLANHQIGSAYRFNTVKSFDDALLRSEITTRWPQSEVNLPNGETIIVNRGVPRTQITLRFREPRSADMLEMARLARSGIVWLDLEHPTQPGWQWPVRLVMPHISRALSGAMQDETTLEFIEVV